MKPKIKLQDLTFDEMEIFLVNRHINDVRIIFKEYTYEELFQFYERVIKNGPGAMHESRGSIINFNEAKEIRFKYIESQDRQLDYLEYLESKSNHSANDYDEMDDLDNSIRYIENFILELNKIKNYKNNENNLFYFSLYNNNPRIGLLDKDALIEIFSTTFGVRF